MVEICVLAIRAKIVSRLSFSNHLNADMISKSMAICESSGDAELVGASLAGDREAFGHIVARYQSLVCSIAYTATGSLSQSEDLAQEIFLAAWKHLAELREPGKLRGWLCGIAKNLINSALRAQGREPSSGAESLDVIPEARSAEPLPVERAISREESEILWRALERIPETYRLPLVLFYREQQSIQAVASQLDLTDEATRQRLSRGRQLLREEVLAFVEAALSRKTHGKTFTVAVVAALPLSTAKAAVGGAVAKGVVGAKSAVSITAAGGILSMLGAILFSWKTLVDDSKTRDERKFTARMGRYQIAFFVVSAVACVTVSVFALPSHPWVFAVSFALLSVANVANAVLIMPYMIRRRMELRMAEASGTDPMMRAMETQMERAFQGEGAEKTTGPAAAPMMSRHDALRRAFKATIPFLIMFAGTAIALPWHQHWIRCAVVMAVLAVNCLWFFRSTYRRLMTPVQPRPAGWKVWLSILCAVFVPVVLGGGGAILLNYFLHPEIAEYWSTQRPLGLGLLVAILACAGFLLLIVEALRLAPKWKWLDRLMDLPILRHLEAFRHIGQSPDAVMDGIYAPLLEELQLDGDQRARLKSLIINRTMVGTRAGFSLLSPKLGSAGRAALFEKIKTETEEQNVEIRNFLGESRHTAFEQYERTIPERMLLDTLKRRLAGTEFELTPAQHQQLFDTLRQARANYSWSTRLSRRTQSHSPDLAELRAQNVDAFSREEEQFNREVLVQVKEILNPRQLEMFQKLLDRQRRSQVSQFKMTARLFGGK